ncbi:MAG: hypothetical protein U5Q03_01885 [Bacteroidota bacterium]|nr:hypothetical protein [Bacteroidota bacterium]
MKQISSKCRVEEIREISPDVYILSYTRPFQFVPGQVVGLTLDPEEAPRLYSSCQRERWKSAYRSFSTSCPKAP